MLVDPSVGKDFLVSVDFESYNIGHNTAILSKNSPHVHCIVNAKEVSLSLNNCVDVSKKKTSWKRQARDVSLFKHIATMINNGNNKKINLVVVIEELLAAPSIKRQNFLKIK